jgi:GNAT superfamily N-acetyltransferase
MCSTFVATVPGDNRVAGYYALSTSGVSAIEAPPRMSKGVGRYDIPVILLARLAVDLEFQDHKLGRALLKDALLRVWNVSEDVGVRAVLIHALNDSAMAFYMSFAEFEPSPTDPLHLFLLMKDLKKALGPQEGT